MNWHRIWALVRKDITEFMKSKYVLSAVIGMPLLFAILFPFSSIMPIAQIDPAEFETADYGGFIDNLFSKNIDNWSSLGAQAQTLIIMAYAMFVMVLMLPIIIPAVTASEAIVGEKERKTMEALIASPMSETEIVLGKIISSVLPSSIGTILAAVGYAIITDILLYPFIGRILFPDFLSVIFVLVFSPLFSIISVELMIMISTRVTSVRDAYQLGSLIVLPLIFLIAAEMFSFFFNTYATLAGGLVIMIIIVLALFKLATSVFDREKAIVKMV